MFRDSCQRGRLSIFYAVGSKPLKIWETHVQDGYITRFLDPEIKSMVLEIGGANVSTTYMVCPKEKDVLGITMPFLVMVVKNMKKYFSFEVTILDDTGTRRRFRVANFQSRTQIMPLSTAMPICLCDGWNQIQFNLYEFTKKAYNKHFVEVQNVKINANIRVRRVYFAEKLVPEEELPAEYRIFYPLGKKQKVPETKQEIQKPIPEIPPPQEPPVAVMTEAQMLEAESKAVHEGKPVEEAKAVSSGDKEVQAKADEGSQTKVEGEATEEKPPEGEGAKEGGEVTEGGDENHSAPHASPATTAAASKTDLEGGEKPASKQPSATEQQEGTEQPEAPAEQPADEPGEQPVEQPPEESAEQPPEQAAEEPAPEQPEPEA